MNGGRILRVVIKESAQEQPTVEVSVPLKLDKWALKLLPVVEGKIKRKLIWTSMSLKSYWMRDSTNSKKWVNSILLKCMMRTQILK